MNLECEGYKEFIIKEYPIWKIELLFKTGVDNLLEYDVSIKQKIKDYELYYNIDIEQSIMCNIINKIALLYRISNKSTFELKDFICDYMSVCIPSFGEKWTKYKMCQ